MQHHHVVVKANWYQTVIIGMYVIIIAKQSPTNDSYPDMSPTFK